LACASLHFGRRIARPTSTSRSGKDCASSSLARLRAALLPCLLVHSFPGEGRACSDPGGLFGLSLAAAPAYHLRGVRGKSPAGGPASPSPRGNRSYIFTALGL